MCEQKNKIKWNLKVRRLSPSQCINYDLGFIFQKKKKMLFRVFLVCQRGAVLLLLWRDVRKGNRQPPSHKAGEVSTGLCSFSSVQPPNVFIQTRSLSSRPELFWIFSIEEIKPSRNNTYSHERMGLNRSLQIIMVNIFMIMKMRISEFSILNVILSF